MVIFIKLNFTAIYRIHANHYLSYVVMLFHYFFTAGLNLALNIEQEDYIGVLTPEAGIRMDISTQGEMPFPLERGVSLAPGYATMIGLRKVKTIIKQCIM